MLSFGIYMDTFIHIILDCREQGDYYSILIKSKEMLITLEQSELWQPIGKVIGSTVPN